MSNTKAPSVIVTKHNITIKFEGQAPKLVPRDHPLEKDLLAAINTQSWDELPGLVDTALSVVVHKTSNGKFTVDDSGLVYVNGVQANPYLSEKIIEFAELGYPYEALLNFVERVGQNPSHRAVQDLYTFLEKNNHPITVEGKFIAFKKVRDNYLDVHSGTFDNRPGNVVKMPRNQVDENPNQTCSNGLHVANWEYASSFYSGGLMIEVEVDPEHVVAIPTDYNQSKMRVCEYKVLCEVDKAEYKTVYNYDYTGNGDQDDSWNDHWDDENDDDTENWCEDCHSSYCAFGDCNCMPEEEEDDPLFLVDELTALKARIAELESR